jgi:hypothetical protein
LEEEDILIEKFPDFWRCSLFGSRSRAERIEGKVIISTIGKLPGEAEIAVSGDADPTVAADA